MAERCHDFQHDCVLCSCMTDGRGMRIHRHARHRKQCCHMWTKQQANARGNIKHAWPKLAAATGSGVISEYRLPTGWPSSASSNAMAVLVGKDGSLSCSSDRACTRHNALTYCTGPFAWF